MRRFLWLSLLLLPFTLALTSGCQRPKEEGPEPRPSKYREGGGSPAAVAGKGQPLNAPSIDGTIVGRVVYDGTPPEMPVIDKMSEHKDAAGCLAGMDFEHRQQTWIVGKDKAVANVVVWLDAKGKYFDKLADEDKDRAKQEVKLDQPHCVFIPHVVAMYPTYFDGKAQQSTKQTFKVLNSANFTHNTKWTGNPLKNPAGTVTLGSGETKTLALRPKDTITFVCDIHPWMQAKGMVFDHPYHAVTDADGKFELRNVPTGVDLTLVFWHEDGEVKERPIKLMQKQTTDEGDVKIKKKT